MKVKLGIIGLGYWGPKLLNAFLKHPGFEVCVAADSSPQRRKWVRSHYPEIQVLDGGAELIAETDLNAVVIATPVETHTQLALMALESGKHIWIEKPLAPTVEEGGSILKAAENSGSQAVVGHLYLYHPGIQALFELATGAGEKCGELGRLFSMQLDWNNQRPPESRFDVVEDLGPHAFSILFHLFGIPEACSAVGGVYIPTGEHRLLDDVSASFLWQDGRTASVHLGWHSPRKVRRVTLFAEGGMTIFDETNPFMLEGISRPTIWLKPGIDSRVRMKSAPITHSYTEGDVILPYHEPGSPLEREVDGFYRAITANQPALNDIKSSLPILEAIRVIHKSIDSGSSMIKFNL